MKNMNTLRKIVLLFVLATIPCFAGKNRAGNDADDDGPQTLVTSVSAGSGGTGTIGITGGVTFAVDSDTTIVVDGKAATLKDVKAGLEVMTQTAPGSSAPEIDLKTVPPAPEKKKKKQAAST
jgi:hypothetical protein